MPSRRPLRKRVALWTAAVVVFLAWYVLAAPFVEFAATKYAPRTTPVLIVFYAPLIFVARDPEAPGHDAFLAYLGWCQEWLRKL
jgi:hypothetical protein